MHHAAGVWGTDYAAFVRKHGCAHVAATVLLPRRDVMVRHVALPGVLDKDLPAAIEFQLDGLHPYREEDVATSWARIPGTSSVLIAITRRAVIERFVTLFAEAGIEVGAFTCSAAAIHSALRMFRTAPLHPGCWPTSPRNPESKCMAKAPAVRCFPQPSMFRSIAPRPWRHLSPARRGDRDPGPRCDFERVSRASVCSGAGFGVPIDGAAAQLTSARTAALRYALAVDPIGGFGRRGFAAGDRTGFIPAL